MSRTATYHTTVAWTGEHWGQITLGNGPEMRFSAPPDAQGPVSYTHLTLPTIYSV